ncbi:MAG: DUF1731 domain-containing protein [Actinomycetaceae bacterium]|nr:DUF1731 domain-containing protein [Actinomycetaceae bacterium]
MARTNVFTYSTFIPHPRERVFEWFQRPGAIRRLTPAIFSEVSAEPSNGLHPGSEAILRLKLPGPLRGLGSIKWVAQHSEFDAPLRVVDMQKRGPFQYWKHVHEFQTVEGGTQMLDTVTYQALPIVPVPATVTSFVNKKLKRLFAYRARQICADIDFHTRYPQHRSIGITGAGGLVGSELRAFLESGGHTVHVLPRPNERIDMELLRQCDAVVHLAGEPIFGRFTHEHQRKVMDSRVEGTRNLAQAMATIAHDVAKNMATSTTGALAPHDTPSSATTIFGVKHTPAQSAGPQQPIEGNHPPSALHKPVLISASAAGYYGANPGDKVLSEHDSSGQDFLSEVCLAWEDACQPAQDAGIRVANMRTGIVQAAGGGQLGTLLPLFELGVGGRISTGKQWVPWIGLDDLVRLYAFAIFEEDVTGPLNAVAPHPVRNHDYTKIVGTIVRRPTVFPVPCVAPALLLGSQGAQEFACAGQRLDASTIEQLGFTFTYPQLEGALRHELCSG